MISAKRAAIVSRISAKIIRPMLPLPSKFSCLSRARIGRVRRNYIWLSVGLHVIQGRKLAAVAVHLRAVARQGGIVRTRLRRSVVLVGMMGSGKTAVGTALARTLGVAFLDSDEAIEKAANMAVSEIFERDGEAFFRAKEAQVLSRLLSGPPAVVSTGGGAYLAPANRAEIAAKGVAVWLKADLDLLWARVRHKTTRPLLRTDNPRETLRRLLEARIPVYEQAELAVEARADYTVEEMAGKVIDALLTRPDVLERS
ncbi:MAG: shikimate kinase [Paracoccaceae bacterium]